MLLTKINNFFLFNYIYLFLIHKCEHNERNKKFTVELTDKHKNIIRRTGQ